MAMLSRYNKDSYRKTRARRTWWLGDLSDHPVGLNRVGGDRRRWEHHLVTTELPCFDSLGS